MRVSQVKISKLLPSTLRTPPADIALPITAALVSLHTDGALVTVGRLMARTVALLGGAMPTPGEVRRALAPLADLRALRWESDGTATLLDVACVRRELQRLIVAWCRHRKLCAACGGRCRTGRDWWRTGMCAPCRRAGASPRLATLA